jgi:hypothetical protein
MDPRILLPVVLMASWTLPAHAGDPPAPPAKDPVQELKDLEDTIGKSPDEPMLYYRKAQCLMKLARREDGYQTAQKAMALFIKKGNPLAWMLLETIDLDNARVDVHFNMGPRERKPPEIGIIKPLSFRVWSKDKDAKLLEIIDFEIGMMDGKPGTAALGQTRGGTHANFGLLEPDVTYEDIRKKAVELIQRRHSKS